MERKPVERRQFSVFIYNIPTKLDHHGLKGVFQRVGRLSDTYIPHRRTRRSNARFEFVRYSRENEAIRSILLFNNANIRGSRSLVSRARHEKGRIQQQSYNMHFTGKRKETYQIELNSRDAEEGVNQESQWHKRALVETINEEFEEWLSKSLVCTTEEPRDLATLASAINNGFGDEGYRLIIREIGLAIQIVHNDSGSSNSSPLEKMDSSGEVPGFEDLMDNLNAENDVAQSNIRFDDPSMADQRREVVQEPPKNQNNSNSNSMAIERPTAFTNQASIYSRARAKTISFSQNGYTEELLKITQHSQSLGNE
ncbi:hypothetical protein Cgig2_017268 [Carnegiea gigantea]|uniref:RRM domain-containing protein n=1 Tax=Carnegiea gigantea TaxID=171969 RepID=A0A9Q1QIT6_9CARY|nr:hypothetical protein Cgig2_017268 [Carnegiea gigantea]